VFEVRKADLDRLERNLEQFDEEKDAGFFWFECLDGRSVIMNLNEVQATRLLWDAAFAPSDLLRHEGGLTVKLRGRAELLEAFPDDHEQVAGFFELLEMGSASSARFTDEDGEDVLIRPAEIVWATYPADRLNAVRNADE
jgi:hypothetical protein